MNDNKTSVVLDKYDSNRLGKYLKEDLEHFQKGEFDRVADPSGLVDHLLNVSKTFDDEEGKKLDDAEDSFPSIITHVGVEILFKDRETELEVLSSLRAALSLYDRIEAVNERFPDVRTERLNSEIMNLKVDGDMAIAINKMDYSSKTETPEAYTCHFIKLKNIPIKRMEPENPETDEEGLIIDTKQLYKGNNFRTAVFSIDENNKMDIYTMRYVTMSLREMFAMIKEIKGFSYRDHASLFQKALDSFIARSENGSVLANIIKDDIHSAFDVDIVMQGKDDIEKMPNAPEWAKSLPAAAALAAFEAQRCVADKDLERLNSPEEQKRFVQALKNATTRQGGHVGRETAYAMAEFFYPDCDQALADTYVFAVYNMSSASHPHEIDTSLQTDDQLRAEVNRLAQIKSSRIIPKKERFTIPETYAMLERQGLTLVKSIANLNGAKRYAKQDLLEYLPKITDRDVCIAVSKEKGKEAACVIKYNEQKGIYDVLKSFGTNEGMEKLTAQTKDINKKISRQNRTPSVMTRD